MKERLKDYAFLFLVAGSIILLDQLSKSWVRSNLGINEILRPDLWLTQYARIVHVKNYGAAFGMFQSLGNVFMVLSIIVSAVIIYYYPQVPRQDWLVRLALRMLLGGAVGNLLDRLYQGYVTDYLSVGAFPVFNIADASISCGVAVLFIGMWMDERKKDAAAALPASKDETPSVEQTPGGVQPEEQPGE